MRLNKIMRSKESQLKNLEYMRQYRLAPGYKEKRSAASRKWRKDNPEKHAANMRQWRLRHPERKEKANAYARQWYADNPEAIKRYHLMKRFGITQSDYDLMLGTQQGRCGICSIKMNVPYVDHDHETGAVRGLLCRRCNLGLGHFADNLKYLEEAVNYLKYGPK